MTGSTLLRSPVGGAVLETATAPSPSTIDQWDFDLHGMVGIRLVGATKRDRAVVAAQLGPIARPLRREPDIVIRFEERLQIGSPLRLLGDGDAAFTDDAFLVLRSRYRSRARVQIAFDAIGGPCEIICERGLSAVPLLLPIINLTVLAKGGLALHASAFRYRDTGVLLTGWSKGGKTEALLAFIENGAVYIGDEWIYIGADGQRMFGLPEPIRVWDWHLSQLPRYRRQLGLRRHVRQGVLRNASRLLGALADNGGASAVRGRHQLGRLAQLIDRQRYDFLSPERAFGNQLGPLAAPLDRVVFVASTESAATYVETVSPEWVADRMVFSLQEEREVFAAYYRKFRFAFPERSNRLVDTASELERQRLRRLLGQRPCHALYHPYPPNIQALFRAAAPVIAG